MENAQLKLLERKIAELLQLCESLNSENRQLKAAAREWEREREQLVQKTELARTKVETMIARLRAPEQES